MEAKVDEKVEEKVNRVSQRASQEASFQSLKDQAFAKRRNLVITGLEEDDSKSAAASAKELFKSLGVDKLGIKEAYRIGQRQPDNTSYARPLIIEFHFVSDRNKVWRKRMKIPITEGRNKGLKSKLTFPNYFVMK